MWYAIISLVCSILLSVSLSDFFNPITVGIVSFLLSFFICCFIDTLAEGENKAFECGIQGIEGVTDDYYMVWPWFFLIPELIFIVVSLVGGIITAPIWYFLSKGISDGAITVLKIVNGVLLGLAYVAGVILIVDPMLVYKLLHFGWIIAGYIVIALTALIITIILSSENELGGAGTTLFSVGAGGLIVIMIVGLVLSLNATYEIRTASDMKVFSNAPVNYNTVFVLKNDIDFENEDVDWFGARKNFKGIFDGKGHTLSNVHVNKEAKSLKDNDSQGLGFVRGNSGIIRNLHFENSTFTVLQNSNEGDEYFYFGIFAGKNYYNGKISGCSAVECYGKYSSTKLAEKVSLLVGENKGTFNAIIDNQEGISKEFYMDGYRDWKEVF